MHDQFRNDFQKFYNVIIRATLEVYFRFHHYPVVIAINLLVVGCSDVYSDSVCINDCYHWIKIYGCASHFPSYCEASGKIKEYCKASCNNCGGRSLL